MEMNLRAQSPLCSRGRPALVVRPSAAATGLTLVSYGLSCCFLPLFAFWSVLFVAGCSDWWVGIREKPLLCGNGERSGLGLAGCVETNIGYGVTELVVIPKDQSWK